MIIAQKKSNVRPTLSLPVQQIKEYYGASLRKPNIELLPIPMGKNQENYLLNQWSARLFGKKLLSAINNIYPYLSNGEITLINQGLEKLFSLSHETLNLLLRRPELTSLILYIESSKDIQIRQLYISPLLNWLKNAPTINNQLTLSQGNEWYKEHHPCKDDPTDSIMYSITSDDFLKWHNAIRAGLALIQKLWPEAYEEIEENIFDILPLRSKGLNPHNYSVHAYRGAICCSIRPDFMLAQSLVHETGHNKFSTITDIYTLIDTNEETTFISPFVNKPRTFIPIFHGIFSFIVDLYISKKMRGRIHEHSHGTLERYIKVILGRVEEAIEIVQTNAVLTEDGHKLFEALKKAYVTF